VLVVEDDAGIRNMLGLALTSFGDVPVLSDGRGPVDADGLDVAILDVRLGNQSVVDFLAAHPELQRLPMILASAGDLRGVQELMPEARVLQKPFDLGALERALDEATTARDSSLRD
jgi:DNA-binding NtrC family response regulator